MAATPWRPLFESDSLTGSLPSRRYPSTSFIATIFRSPSALAVAAQVATQLDRAEIETGSPTPIDRCNRTGQDDSSLLLRSPRFSRR